MRVAMLGAGLAALLTVVATASAQTAGDPQKGAQLFRACAACHSLHPGRHLTGPSLAGIWERQAGTVEGFTRYSQALKDSSVVWNAAALDPWLADPRSFIPNNTMVFAGIKDAKPRADLIAFLEAVSTGRMPAPDSHGMMSGEVPPLKNLEPSQRVVAIRYCDLNYSVTTAAGETQVIWERNLRFKTDSSESGPQQGQPALMPAGSMGDRASIIFATPAEISAFIEVKC